MTAAVVATTLIDAAGTVHRRAGGPVRIVSLVPSITECLCALGLRAALVGRTGFCVQPREELRDVARVGGTKDVDIDKVRSLAPTHVILNIDENTRETAAALGEFVPNLVVTHPLAPEDNFALYELLGGIFGRETQAATLARSLRAELDAIRNAPALPRRRVLYLIWRKPWMTVARDTYISRMLALVNWETYPREAGRRYPEIELRDGRSELDLVLLSSEPYPFRERHVALVRDELGPGPDVRLVQGDMLSWYGSRAIAGVAYLRQLAQSIVPATRPADASRPVTQMDGEPG